MLGSQVYNSLIKNLEGFSKRIGLMNPRDILPPPTPENAGDDDWSDEID